MVADQIYKVRDPQGNIREIKGPAGASDEEVIAQAKKLFAVEPAKTAEPEKTGQPSSGIPGPRLRSGRPASSPLRDIRNLLGPTIEAVPAALGGIAGTAVGGPLGMVAGAGLGYGAGKQVTRLMDVALGDQPAPTAGQAMLGGVEDVLTGATTEAGGNVAGRVIGKVASPVAEKVGQALTGSQERARAILRQTLGRNVGQARQALQAQPGMTAGEALADVNAPAFQALYQRAVVEKDPAFARALALAQRGEGENALAALAGGSSQAAARTARGEAFEDLSKRVAPLRETELGAANEAQRVISRLAPQAAARQASMISALREGVPPPVPAPAAPGLVRGTVAGQPRTGQSATHSTTEAAQLETDLARRRLQGLQRPDQVVPEGTPVDRYQEFLRRRLSVLAADSREAGEIFAEIAKQRRAEKEFIERQIGSLEAYGLRPLSIDPIIKSINTTLETPGLRASNELTRVLSLVKDDLLTLAERNGGRMDVHDLYTIRKEGIAQRVRDVVKQEDPKASAKLTASVLKQLNPLIDDAIEKAGGTGWRTYLKTYSEGMDEIARKEMAAEALQKFRDSPLEYVKLVRGNNTDAVEAVFGPGRFDIFKEMAKEMPTLSQVAKQVERGAAMKEQADLGQKALLDIYKQNRQLFSVPWGLSPAGAVLNRVLAKAEEKVGEKTMSRLTEALKSGESTEKLLNKLSAAERREIVRAMREAGQDILIPKGAKGAAVNQLLPEGERENRNALNQ